MTLRAIFDEERKAGKPRVYFYSQIKEVELYHETQKVDWMDLRVEYENHDRKVTYQIYEDSHEASQPSFEIWLPAQKDSFFLKFYFSDPDHSKLLNSDGQQPEDNLNHSDSKVRQLSPVLGAYGQAYLNMPIKEKMSKKTMQELEITREGKKIGMCKVAIRTEPDVRILYKVDERGVAGTGGTLTKG